MRKHFLVTLSVLVLSSLACTITIPWIPKVGTSQLQTFTFSEQAPPGAKVVNVSIAMGAGALNIQGGATTLVAGKVEYNVDGWKPQVTKTDNGIQIEQQTGDVTNIPTQNVQNNWNVQLGDTTPISFNLKAGAYKGTIDLSGVPLSDVNISDGASDATVEFKQTNPASMDTFQYKTGFSTVKLLGLAYAGFQQMTFSGGAGTYTLDFGGTLQRDTNVKVTGGGANVDIIIPQGMASQVNITSSLTNVNSSGQWNVSNNNVYVSQGSGPTLYITVDVGVGNITLVNQ